MKNLLLVFALVFVLFSSIFVPFAQTGIVSIGSGGGCVVNFDDSNGVPSVLIRKDNKYRLVQYYGLFDKGTKDRETPITKVEGTVLPGKTYEILKLIGGDGRVCAKTEDPIPLVLDGVRLKNKHGTKEVSVDELLSGLGDPLGFSAERRKEAFDLKVIKRKFNRRGSAIFYMYKSLVTGGIVINKVPPEACNFKGEEGSFRQDS